MRINLYPSGAKASAMTSFETKPSNSAYPPSRDTSTWEIPKIPVRMFFTSFAHPGQHMPSMIAFFMIRTPILHSFLSLF